MWGYMKCDMCTFRVDIDMKKIYMKFYKKFYKKILYEILYEIYDINQKSQKFPGWPEIPGWLEIPEYPEWLYEIW